MFHDLFPSVLRHAANHFPDTDVEDFSSAENKQGGPETEPPCGELPITQATS
jgi:hypothetical protein